MTAGSEARAAARRIVLEVLENEERARGHANQERVRVHAAGHSEAHKPSDAQVEDHPDAVPVGVDVPGGDPVDVTVEEPDAGPPPTPVTPPLVRSWPNARVDLLPQAVPPAQVPAPSPVWPPTPARSEAQAPSADPRSDTGARAMWLDRWRARRRRKRLAAQWAPGATPTPRRTWRWVLATMVAAIAIAVLFPLTIAAIRALVAL